MGVSPQFAPRSRPLASGLLLLLYAVGGVILLAVLNGVLLTLLLRLFLDREQIVAARMGLVPLAFLLAIAELVLYEWRRAQVADLIGPILSAIQEALSQIPSSTLPEEPHWQKELLHRSLKELQHLLASPDPETGQRLASTLQEVLTLLGQMTDAEKDRFRRLRTLLEKYQRRQAVRS
jgi:hypothetical protein